MDQLTHEVRIANWKAIIERCQSRPEGQSAREWLAENNIPNKQYYYWLRKLRKMAYSDANQHEIVPAASIPQAPSVSFAEIPMEAILPAAETGTEPAITIKTRKSTIQISSAVSEELMVKLIKAVSHAI